MTSSVVVTRYANALADVVMGPSSDLAPTDAAAQLRAFAQLASDSADLRNALTSPTVSLARKRAVISHLTDALHTSRTVRNFLFILSDRRRLDALSQVASSFEAVLDERLGFARAEVRSASPLTPAQQDMLLQKFSTLTGKKIRPTYAVDPGLIGGVLVHLGSKVYDGSVRGQLAAIGRRLTVR